MKRRQFLGAAAGFSAGLGASFLPRFSTVSAQTSGLTIQALGHSCFLFSGDGQKVLLNPFRQIGCTQGYAAPKVSANLVMISSRLFDEGYVEGLPGNPRILYEPGAYQLGDQQIQGIRTEHDRFKGRRFGQNVAWRWSQGGLTILHLGGAAAPISVEQKILMGTPDVLLVPVSGGPKAYTPEEAKAAIATLNPKLIIPTQYRTSAADPNACDSETVEAFLNVMQGTSVKRAGNQLSLQKSSLPTAGSMIQVMSAT